MPGKQLNSRFEFAEEVQRLLDILMSKQKMMVAFWYVEDTTTHYAGKVTWDFPKASFLAAMRLVLEDMDNDCQEESSPPAPLKVADLAAMAGRVAEANVPQEKKKVESEPFTPKLVDIEKLTQEPLTGETPLPEPPNGDSDG